MNKRAFSLIELIIVVAIIAILAIAGISVYNPSGRIADANTALRAKAAESLESAIKQAILNNEELPAEMAAISSTLPTLLVTSGNPGTDTYYCAKLGFAIPKVNIASYIEPLLGDLPIDPELDTASTDTGYFVVRKGNLFNVGSCSEPVNCSTCSGDECVGCPVCGNGVVENGEACDDGNLKNERCSNGVLEVGTFCNSTCLGELVLNEICDYQHPAVWQCDNGGSTFTSTVVGSGTLCEYGGVNGCQVYLETCGGAQQSNNGF